MARKLAIFFYLCKVKKILKIAALLYLVVLYSFFSAYKTNNLSEEKVHAQSSNEKDFSPFSPTILFLHLTLPEKVVSGFNPFSFPNKNRTTTFWKFNKTAELILSRKTTTYRICAKNIYNSFHQTDIIFPFHYFW